MILCHHINWMMNNEHWKPCERGWTFVNINTFLHTSCHWIEHNFIPRVWSLCIVMLYSDLLSVCRPRGSLSNYPVIRLCLWRNVALWYNNRQDLIISVAIIHSRWPLRKVWNLQLQLCSWNTQEDIICHRRKDSPQTLPAPLHGLNSRRFTDFGPDWSNKNMLYPLSSFGARKPALESAPLLITRLVSRLLFPMTQRGKRIRLKVEDVYPASTQRRLVSEKLIHVGWRASWNKPQCVHGNPI